MEEFSVMVWELCGVPSTVFKVFQRTMAQDKNCEIFWVVPNDLALLKRGLSEKVWVGKA